MEQQSFGHWLRLKRKALDFTREDLAERIGYSAASIRKIEDEERRPSTQIVERLAEIFKIPPAEQTAFLRFARGDPSAAPSGNVEEAPWRVLPVREQPDPSHPRTHLATFLFTDIEGSTKLMLKNWASALAGFREALIAAHQLKSKYEIVVTLAWWGVAEKQLGNPARSVHLFWAHKNILDSIGVWSEDDESEFESDLAPCRASLGEEAFTQAVEEGQAMTMEQAIAYALEDTD